MKKIRIGTRGSKLALRQTELVISALTRQYPHIEFQVQVIKTTGDRILDKGLNEIGEKGLFVKEIEEALAKREIDLAVHSMKDVPNALPQGFCLGAILKREDPRDVLLSKNKVPFSKLPPGAVVGTGSLRRIVQLQSERPDLRFETIRGNIDTRIKKMKQGEVDAIILAAAGLKRLGWEEAVAEYFDVNRCIPAVGQGVLGIEILREYQEMADILQTIHHREDACCVLAERAFLAEVNGGCHIPVGAYAYIMDHKMYIQGFLGTEEGRIVRTEMTGSLDEYESVGKKLGRELMKMGGVL